MVRVFTLQNFLFYDEDGILILYTEVIKERLLAQQTGQQYDTEQNCMNDQVVKQNRDASCPKMCPVKLVIDSCRNGRSIGG